MYWWKEKIGVSLILMNVGWSEDPLFCKCCTLFVLFSAVYNFWGHPDWSVVWENWKIESVENHHDLKLTEIQLVSTSAVPAKQLRRHKPKQNFRLKQKRYADRPMKWEKTLQLRCSSYAKMPYSGVTWVCPERCLVNTKLAGIFVDPAATKYHSGTTVILLFYPFFRCCDIEP